MSRWCAVSSRHSSCHCTSPSSTPSPLTVLRDPPGGSTGPGDKVCYLFCCCVDEQVVCCRLSSLQSSLYKSLINSKSTLSALAKAGSSKIAASSLSSIMHLKKLCNRTSLRSPIGIIIYLASAFIAVPSSQLIAM